MAKGAVSEKLRQGFEHHLEQTKGHVERLDQIFSHADSDENISEAWQTARPFSRLNLLPRG